MARIVHSYFFSNSDKETTKLHFRYASHVAFRYKTDCETRSYYPILFNLAGLLALNKVGVEVESYFSSEIDPDAEMVTKTRLKNVIRMGDVTMISRNMVRK